MQKIITVVYNPANFEWIPIPIRDIRQQLCHRSWSEVQSALHLTHNEQRKWCPRPVRVAMQTKVAMYANELRDVRLHKLTANAQKLYEKLKGL